MISRPVACADTTFGPATPRDPERATNTKSETPAGDSLNAIRPGRGRSVSSPTRDHTTVKCRRLSVAMSRMPSRSAVAITEAVPSGRLRQAATSSAIRIQSLAATLFSKEVASTLAVRSPGFGLDSPPAAAISTKPSSGTGVRRSSTRCKAPASPDRIPACANPSGLRRRLPTQQVSALDDIIMIY